MLDRLKNFLNRLRSNSKIRTFDEASTKQAIVLPLLDILGWCTYDVEEVFPEYSVENRRVDYALRINGTNEFFIEVKNTGEDLEKHEEQLLDYSFRQGVQLGALTNGITWWFYLPTKKGDWKTRKFYTIDVLKQGEEDIASRFIDLLFKENVESGKAFGKAESIYKSRLKEKTLTETIPEAWNTIISEPDSLLVDLVSETTERLCGFKPDDEEVMAFIRAIGPGVPVSYEPPKKKKPKDISLNGISTDKKLKVILKSNDLPIYFPYKKKMHEAVMPRQEFVKTPSIIYEGKKYSSPSAAAIAVIQKYTNRTTEDGWRVWRYKDHQTGELIPINNLRK